jgi:hypothetical protein
VLLEKMKRKRCLPSIQLAIALLPASALMSGVDAFAQNTDSLSTQSNVTWRSPKTQPTSQSNAPQVETTSARTSRSNAKPIYWNKSDFLIPFNVGNQGRMPKSVELEVSTDSGANWNVVQKSDLASRQFTFRSNGDGLYWFRIKTIDENGRGASPSAQPMAIVIDTVQPQIDLVIDTDEQARMVADFRIADANLSGADMRLEYQTELDPNWLPVPLQTQFGRNSMELVGKGTWEVPIRAKSIVVRFVVRDLAGNESEQTRLPTMLRTAANDLGMKLTSGPGTAFNDPHPTQEQSSVGFVPEVLPAPPLAVNTAPQAISPFQTNLPFQANQPMTNEPVLVLGPEPAQQSASRFTFSNIDPEEARQALTTDQPTNMSSPAVTQVAPRQPQAYGSSSRAFSLDYNVEIDGGNQVADVELWATTDQGQSWAAWGKDPDKQSPFDIRVQNDGLFGFRMVVIGTNGLANNRPIAGDDADAWIQVDTQLPTARIQSAKYGQGAEAGNLIVEYTASDEHFAERPIAFSYSQSPDGPWTTIATEQPNNGRFAWPGNPNLPRRVYLRIEAYDQAGNVYIDRLEMPIDLEGLAPRGRIQGFRPLPNN